MKCWRLSVNKFESLKFQEDLVIGGTFTLLWVLPLGAIQGPKSEYQGKFPSSFWQGEGKRNHSEICWHTLVLLNKTCSQEKLFLPELNLLGFYQSLLLLLLLNRFSRVQLCATPQTAAHQAPRPWDSPGKNTGVGCHFLLQCMKVKSESEVAQPCPTLCGPMDCSLPGSSVHGIFQASVLEWGAIAFSYQSLT